MKTFLLTLMLATIIGFTFTSVSLAKVKPSKPKTTLDGVITRIEQRNLFVMTSVNGDGYEKEIVTVKGTRFFLDGKEVTLDDLASGLNVKITPVAGDPIRIDATTPGKSSSGGKKGKKKST